tara:strand:- start:1303 stop:1695 length:393 start_codon:yes stop_codon:yes gene_type:complete
MNWKFSCETTEEVPLPPEYSFPRAFNYLNSESNSFYILENEHGYIQCAGSKHECTVELREINQDGTFKHYVFFSRTGSDDPVNIKMSNGDVHRQRKHCFGFLKAAKLFTCFHEGSKWPSEIGREDITFQF